MRGVTLGGRVRHRKTKFQLTRLMRGVTNSIGLLTFRNRISTHTPHARRDRSGCSRLCALRTFQLTRLMRGVTLHIRRRLLCKEISTHTPHARRDRHIKKYIPGMFSISTHTPHARRDSSCYRTFYTSGAFQLTRLMRGVTLFRIYLPEYIEISTHTPHARRDCRQGNQPSEHRHFNSHASCEA